MEDESTNAMNLNLNLGLNDDSSNDTEPEVGSFTHEAMNSGHWLGGEPIRIGGSLPLRPRQRRRPPWRPLWRQLQVSPIASRVDEEGGSIEQEEENKTYDKKDDVFLSDELFGKEGCEEKRNNDDTRGSFFDCNVCLDLANDPIVTCCGHLFCWICIYKWLHFHSDAKECPVCKGEVSLKNLTPIYGRGESVKTQSIDDVNLKIPNRPQAQRVESWRQVMHRSDFDVHMEEVVLRRLVNRRSFRSRAHNDDDVDDDDDDDDDRHESSERSNFVLNQLQAYRPTHRETNDHNVFDHLPQRNSEPGESSQIPISGYYQRMNSNLAVVLSNLSTLRSADQVIESYLPNRAAAAAVDDRDSMSSIAAIIESESQTVDTPPIENDPTVLLSTSSSSSRRRNNNSSRVSDLSSGDSRRRRLN